MEPVCIKRLDEGIRVEVHTDPDPYDPREDMDHLGTMVCWHRSYALGDRKIREFEYGSPQEIITEIMEDEGPMAAQLPLYLYDHSGITMSTTSERFRVIDHAGWDWGVVGFIYVSKAKMEEERLDVNRAEEILRAEVEVYNSYLTGDVYGYEVKDADGKVLESCWGFIGDTDYCLNEGVAEAEWYVERERGPQPVLGVLP